MCAGSCRKSGTIGVPDGIHPGRGTKGLKSGTQPYLKHMNIWGGSSLHSVTLTQP